MNNEIRERADIFLQAVESFDDPQIAEAWRVINDLLAELERVKTENRIRGEMYADLQHRTGACEHVRLKQRIAELEAENERMKADLSGSFFVEQIRQKAAMDCVDEMEGYPTSVSVHVTAHDAKIATATKLELIAAVKAKFGLEKK